MQIEYGASKRQKTLDARGLDFESIVAVFDAFHLIRTDDRKDYGEVRHIMLGALEGRPVICVWTRRGDAIRVISMRMADDDERDIYWRELERSR